MADGGLAGDALLPNEPNDPLLSLRPASGVLFWAGCDQLELDLWGGAGGGLAEDDLLPNEPKDEFRDDVDRLLLVGEDFWEENPLLYELELERELELEAGFALADIVAAAGSSRASSNII